MTNFCPCVFPTMALGKISLCVAILLQSSAQDVFLGAQKRVSEVSSTAPQLKYWHNYNDHGQSRLVECSFNNLTSREFIPGVAPLWQQMLDGDDNIDLLSQSLLVDPADTFQDWHNDPFVQLNLFVSGEGEWTTEHGSKTFKAGDFYLGNDIDEDDDEGEDEDEDEDEGEDED